MGWNIFDIFDNKDISDDELFSAMGIPKDYPGQKRFDGTIHTSDAFDEYVKKYQNLHQKRDKYGFKPITYPIIEKNATMVKPISMALQTPIEDIEFEMV